MLVTSPTHICDSCGARLRHGVASRLDEIPGLEHCKRGLEVALAGRHSIAFFTDRQAYGLAEALSAYAAAHGLVTWLEKCCPCGGRLSKPPILCTCSNDQIVKHQQSQHYQNALAASIVIEAVAPRPEAVVSFAAGRRGEADEQILERVRRAAAVTVSDELDETSRRLLRSALSQGFLYPDQVAGIKSVAKSIAGLGGSSMIRAAHLAEALQYRPRPEYKLTE